jgi:hypothetical protein
MIIVADPVRVNDQARSVLSWTDALTTVGWVATEVDCLDGMGYDGLSYPDVMLKADLSYIRSIGYLQEIYNEYGPNIDWIFEDCHATESVLPPRPKLGYDSSETLLVGVTSWTLDCLRDIPAGYHHTSYSFDSWILLIGI